MTKAAKTIKTKTADQPTGAIRNIPLAMLGLSPLNPRRNVTDEDIAALADSIRTVGLMQNLSGIETEVGRIGIVAGGRRLRALKFIAAEAGKDEAGYSIPVRIAANETEARLWAATENTAREPLNPADEIRAYAGMSDTGATPQTIAKAFAVTVRHVKGRMKLAGLAAAILDALGVGEITLDTAAAYTVCDDQDRQLEVYTQLKGTWNADSDHHIRRLLTNDAADQSSKLARFVTRETYENAGGAISEDLFGEDTYFLDGELLTSLALEKLEHEAKSLRAQGWKWVETGLVEPDWSLIQKMGRTYPQQVQASEEEAARYDELAEMMEAEAASEAEQAEFEALAAKLDREDYSAEQKAHSGIILSIGYRGDVSVRAGMMKPEDRAGAEASGVIAPARHAQTSQSTPAEKPLYTAALAEDMARIRTGAVQAALLDKPELALDLLAFALSTESYGGAIPLGIRADKAANQPKDGEGMDLPDRLTERNGEGYDMMNAPRAADAFTAFRARPKKERNAILTESIARAFSIGLAGKTVNPLAEAVAGLAGTKPRSVWTPTESYLKRLTAAQLDAIHAEIMGETSPGFAKMKKGEKATRLHGIFEGKNGIPPMSAAQKARVAQWLPEGMIPVPQAQTDSPASEAAA